MLLHLLFLAILFGFISDAFMVYCQYPAEGAISERKQDKGAMLAEVSLKKLSCTLLLVLTSCETNDGGVSLSSFLKPYISHNTVVFHCFYF